MAVDGPGLRLTLDPGLRPSALLRPAPADPLPLYPDGPGLGERSARSPSRWCRSCSTRSPGSRPSAAALSAASARRSPTSATRWSCAPADSFTRALVTAFAADPAAALAGPPAAGRLHRAHDAGRRARPRRTPLVAVTGAGPVTLAFGTADVGQLTLAAAGPPSIDSPADWTIPDVGAVARGVAPDLPAGVARRRPDRPGRR